MGILSHKILPLRLQLNSLFPLDVKAIAVVIRASFEFAHDKNSPLDTVLTHVFVTRFLLA